MNPTSQGPEQAEASARVVFLRFDEPVAYARALAVQEALVALRIADAIPDTFLLLQHPPVITLGRRGRREHLLVDEAELARRGVTLETASRGGDVTYHAPGQWVLYPILRVRQGTHRLLDQLEGVAIGTAEAVGVKAFRREGKAGGWTSAGKFAAIGFALRRWVSYHGMSLNVEIDLAGFELIVGCGLVGERVTSLAAVRDGSPGMAAVADALEGEIRARFNVEWDRLDEMAAWDWVREKTEMDVKGKSALLPESYK